MACSVATATTEQSFITMCCVKAYLRSKMSTKCLSGLRILNIYLDSEEIVEFNARRNERRMELLFKEVRHSMELPAKGNDEGSIQEHDRKKMDSLLEGEKAGDDSDNVVDDTGKAGDDPDNVVDDTGKAGVDPDNVVDDTGKAGDDPDNVVDDTGKAGDDPDTMEDDLSRVRDVADCAEMEEVVPVTAEPSDKLTQGQNEPDEYLYTKRDEFTSEIYKIQISNMPKRFGFAELKKKFLQLDLKPVKMKALRDICFVTFRCEEDREDALKKVNGLVWRGRTLQTCAARPSADPLILKRKQEEAGKTYDKKAKYTDDHLTPSERLKNSVTPLWKLEYKEQLRKKEGEMRLFLKKLHKQLLKICPDLQPWLLQRKKMYGAIPCELQDIIPSPVTEGYRNKCELTIGPGLDGEDVVGFRYGTYVQGSVYVGSPEEVSILPDSMKAVIRVFQKYVSASKYKVFNPEYHSGNWRQLAIRTSRLGHVMAIIDFHPQTLTQADVDKEIESIKTFFTTADGAECGITSCFFRSHTEKMTAASDDPHQLVFGEEHITELLLGMKFQISPSAFFQVNTAAAEVLYKTISDWCNASSDATVLDVCCGTGTIGLAVAKNVSKVIGIEMCSQAIDDAKVNAKLNGISNVTYHCAKAEDVMKDITRSVLGSTEVVAIVDPPRGGLHSSVLVAIRNCRSINRLVYVSCNVNGALNNFVDLVRPISKRLKGERFYPVKAVPVDIFPHTNHCELVMLFERAQPDSQS